MKVTTNDFSVMSGAIKRFLHLYTMDEISRSKEVFYTSSKANNKYIAFIWAIYFKVKNNDETLKDMMLERAYNDAHIETALKKIFKEYGIKG
jgi:hypothetical protein